MSATRIIGHPIRPGRLNSYGRLNVLFIPGNEEIVDLELDYLVETRNPGGVWNITWTWFGLGDEYPKEFAISENWWMASKAIERLSFLEAFGRMER